MWVVSSWDWCSLCLVVCCMVGPTCGVNVDLSVLILQSRPVLCYSALNMYYVWRETLAFTVIVGSICMNLPSLVFLVFRRRSVDCG